MRGRFYRTRDRGSYKSSEVVGLFIISLIGGMILSAMAVLIDYVLTMLFG